MDYIIQDIKKAYEITDARISFISLVEKGANKREFIIVKNQNERSFTTDGKILDIDSDSHFVTGVVYEPMEEDAHGNYMTKEEIQKACYWFAKNGNNVDLEHNENKIDSCFVVENWVCKSNCVINGQAVKEGSWVMTVEVNDYELFEKIKNGQINGFSMGGVGKYSKDDTIIEKTQMSKKSILTQIANLLGIELSEKKLEEEENNMKPEDVQKMIDDAINKLLGNERKVQTNDEELEEVVKMAVSNALEPILKSRGISHNLNYEQNKIEKNSQHYLSGIL